MKNKSSFLARVLYQLFKCPVCCSNARPLDKCPANPGRRVVAALGQAAAVAVLGTAVEVAMAENMGGVAVLITIARSPGGNSDWSIAAPPLPGFRWGAEEKKKSTGTKQASVRPRASCRAISIAEETVHDTSADVPPPNQSAALTAPPTAPAAGWGQFVSSNPFALLGNNNKPEDDSVVGGKDVSILENDSKFTFLDEDGLVPRAGRCAFSVARAGPAASPTRSSFVRPVFCPARLLPVAFELTGALVRCPASPPAPLVCSSKGGNDSLSLEQERDSSGLSPAPSFSSHLIQRSHK